MLASVPLDVDVEDRLIYGLSPQRFGYLVLAGLSAMTLWSLAWVPQPVRIALCVVPLAAGAALAWGGWRGRGLDLCLYDAAVYLARNYRLQLDLPQRAQRLPAVPIQPGPAERALSACTSPGLELSP